MIKEREREEMGKKNLTVKCNRASVTSSTRGNFSVTQEMFKRAVRQLKVFSGQIEAIWTKAYGAINSPSQGYIWPWRPRQRVHNG
jgi:hypothetical protein